MHRWRICRRGTRYQSGEQAAEEAFQIVMTVSAEISRSAPPLALFHLPWVSQPRSATMGLIRAIQLAQRAPSRSLANRAYSTSSARPFIITSTLFSPTPDFLASHLASNPAPTDSLTLYTICTTLPSLPGLLPHLQRLPNSIGSFSHPRPVQAGQNQPYISLAHFPRNGGSVFHTALTGRRPVEVGRWHRPHPDGVGKEDLKGGEMGDLGDVRGAGLGGWGEAWEADAGAADERVQGLEGVE